MTKRKGGAWRDYGFGKNDPQQATIRENRIVRTCPNCQHPDHRKNKNGWCYKSGCFCSTEMKSGT